MARRHNKTGRSTGGPAFIQIFRYMYESPAYRSLSPAERAILLAVAARYNGSNNGFIGLGVRDAAEECNVNKDTAGRCFQTLQDRGFLEKAQASAFSRKDRVATEWRLTWQQCDRTGHKPSKAFMRDRKSVV